MIDKATPLFGVIENYEPVNLQDLERFKQKMANEVIPRVVRIIEDRQVKAIETRVTQMKC